MIAKLLGSILLGALLLIVMGKWIWIPIAIIILIILIRFIADIFWAGKDRDWW